MLKHLLFNKTPLYSLWVIVATKFSFTPFAFISSLLSSTKNEYIFVFHTIIVEFVRQYFVQIEFTNTKICWFVKRVNVTLLLRITAKSLPNIFDTHSLVLMPILNSLFCCLQVLYQFLKISIVLSYIGLFINLNNAFASLPPFFLFPFFFVY